MSTVTDPGAPILMHRLGRVWRRVITKVAEPRAKISRRGLRWALGGLIGGYLTVTRVAAGLGMS